MRLSRYALLCILACRLWAQAPTGDITGVVTDVTGAVVSGAGHI